MVTMIIGGARSGKSRFAQSLCPAAGRVAYIATLRPEDDEMRARVARHRRDRPLNWTTVEEPLSIASAVRRAAGHAEFVVLDCLTIWLSNLCWQYCNASACEIEQAAEDEVCAFFAPPPSVELIVVTNEVGCSIVPENPVGRLFRDMQGFVNQKFAASAQRVFQVVAGIPIEIKSPGTKP